MLFEIQPNNLNPMSIQNIADNFTDHFRSTVGLSASGCIRTEPNLLDLQSVGLLLTMEKARMSQRIQQSSKVTPVSVVNQSLLNLRTTSKHVCYSLYQLPGPSPYRLSSDKNAQMHLTEVRRQLGQKRYRHLVLAL